jgi:hypothetical protein
VGVKGPLTVRAFLAVCKERRGAIKAAALKLPSLQRLNLRHQLVAQVRMRQKEPEKAAQCALRLPGEIPRPLEFEEDGGLLASVRGSLGTSPVSAPMQKHITF